MAGSIAMPPCGQSLRLRRWARARRPASCSHCSTRSTTRARARRSEEHTSELQSLMRISYAVFCLKKKNKRTKTKKMRQNKSIHDNTTQIQQTQLKNKSETQTT